MNDRTSLYRHFDAAGALLYIGISASHTRRLAEHEETARWFQDVARVDVEYYKTREDAIMAEIAAIKVEMPKFNLSHSVREQTRRKPIGNEFNLCDAIDEMGLSAVGGDLPADLAKEINSLCDEYMQKAKDLVEQRRLQAE